MTKYFQDCDREGIQFYPVVVEALGGWHEDAAALITRLARQLASHTGKEVDEQIKHLFQRMGILLMRGNSALIIIRTPEYADAEDDRDLDFLENLTIHQNKWSSTLYLVTNNIIQMCAKVYLWFHGY